MQKLPLEYRGEILDLIGTSSVISKAPYTLTMQRRLDKTIQLLGQIERYLSTDSKSLSEKSELKEKCSTLSFGKAPTQALKVIFQNIKMELALIYPEPDHLSQQSMERLDISTLTIKQQQLLTENLSVRNHKKFTTELWTHYLDPVLLYKHGTEENHKGKPFYKQSRIARTRNFLDTYTQEKIREIFNYHNSPIKIPSAIDKYSRKVTYASLKALQKQRIQLGIKNAVDNNYHIIFTTLTLSTDGIGRFSRDLSISQKGNAPTPQKKFFLSLAEEIKTQVITEKLSAWKLKQVFTNQKMIEDKREILLAQYNPYDWFKYVIVPELGDKNGRFHFHALLAIKTMPDKYKQDPNHGSSQRNNTEIKKLSHLWGYGNSQHIAVRYRGDPFGKDLKWLTPLQYEKDGQQYAPSRKGAMALGAYMSKYLTKLSDGQLVSSEYYSELTPIKKQLIMQKRHVMSEKLGTSSIKTRVNFSRNWNGDMESMAELSPTALYHLTLLSAEITPFTKLIRNQAKSELATRFPFFDGEELISSSEFNSLAPEVPNYMKALNETLNGTYQLSTDSLNTISPRLCLGSLNQDAANWLYKAGLTKSQIDKYYTESAAGK